MGTLRKLAKLAILLLIANALYRFIPSYLHYQQFKDDVRETAIFSKELPDTAIVEQVLAKAEDRGVPIDRDNVVITHDVSNIYITVSWVEDIAFAPFYTYPWEFDVRARAIQNLTRVR